MIFKRTKILATLGPVTSTPEKIEELMKAGVNGFRLNFSHGTHEERDEQIPWIRAASEKLVSQLRFYKICRVQNPPRWTQRKRSRKDWRRDHPRPCS